jgi:hypothetical protein
MIIGAALIVAGIALGSVSTSLIQKAALSTLPDISYKTTLPPNGNITKTVMAKVGERFTVLAGSDPPNPPITTIVSGPDGKVLLQSTGQEANQIVATENGPLVITLKNNFDHQQAIPSHRV